MTDKKIEYNKTPKLSEQIEIYPFDKKKYLLVQTEYNYRIKINKVTHELISLIDGERSIHGLSELLSTQLDQLVTPEQVHSIIYDNLGQYGFIIDYDKEVKSKGRPSYLKLSVLAISPKVVKKIGTLFSFLFSFQSFIITLLICSSIVLFVIINYTSSINYSLNNISGYGIGMYILVKMVSKVFHEIGHASACISFGAEQGGIGFGYYLISPVLFTDVSDIWKLEKKQRIFVNLSGVYFEMIFACFLVVILILLGKTEIILLPLLIFLFTLFNLFPFFRSDGYWILSDLAQVTNLKDQSDKQLKQIFLSIFNKENKAIVRNWFLIGYSFLNNALIIILLFYILFVNPTSLVTFPNDVFNLFKNIFSGTGQDWKWYITTIFSFFMPITFYVILYRYLKVFFKDFNWPLFKSINT